MRHTHAFTSLTLVLALSLVGCGVDDETGTSSSATRHNDTDVAFASDMIQHHAQALSMVDLTLGRDLDAEVEELAEDIRAAQTPEIETMSDWLTDWDEKIPMTVRDHVNADGDVGNDMDDMGTDMPGMMTGDDMAALEEASDAEFQHMWVTMMIEHHEGAVEMAQDEQADGAYQPAADLAEDIEKSQTVEIDTMQDLLP